MNQRRQNIKGAPFPAACLRARLCLGTPIKSRDRKEAAEKIPIKSLELVDTVGAAILSFA